MVPEEVRRAAKDPEKLFGKYVLLERIGGGGMGEVFRAWDRTLSRVVALKRLRNLDPEAMARFQREARLAAGLSHPNIATVHEFGRVKNQAYLSLEYIDGETLGSRERDLRTSVQACRDAARALAYAHDRGVIHRDVNPRNILLARDGRAVVTDFGIARQNRPGSTVTETGMVVGTPAFMAPEQARGDRTDARTDVYGLGATLYALVTQSPPFPGDEAMKVVLKVLEEEPVPVRRLNPKADRPLATIIETAMQKDPARRYPTIRALADDLDRWLEGRPISTRTPGVLTRLGYWARRRARLTFAGVTTIAVLAVLATLLLVGVGRRRERDRRGVVMGHYQMLQRIVSDFEADPTPGADETGETRRLVEAEVKRILELDRSFGYALVEAARFYWHAGDRRAAFEALDESIRRTRDNPSAFLTRGRFRLKEYVSFRARRLAEASLQTLFRIVSSPESMSAPTVRAQQSLRQGVADMEQYVKLARRQSDDPATGEAELAFARAVQDFYRERYEAAWRGLETARRSVFLGSDAEYLASIVACLIGRYGEIEGRLERCAARTEERIEARILIAVELLGAVKATDEARAAFVENLARLIVLAGGEEQVDLLRRIPAFLWPRIKPLVDEARRRADALREK